MTKALGSTPSYSKVKENKKYFRPRPSVKPGNVAAVHQVNIERRIIGKVHLAKLMVILKRKFTFSRDEF